jgi:hypothetical protein
MVETTENELEARVPGWGVDRNPRLRPGHPLYQEYRVAHDTLAGEPPWTDTVPLKGLSGVIRRMAYELPDWKPRRWLMLMLADRVDKLESMLTARNLLLAGGIGGLVAALAIRLRRR